MRIVSGKLKGKKIVAPKTINARPTTDFGKESLFNILNHLIDYSGINVLDLFAGTGNISYEFSSRGAQKVTSVDQSLASYRFINSFARENKLDVSAIKSDVYKFIKQKSNSTLKFDLIFADPPYALDNIDQIPQLIKESGLLAEDGILVLEHGDETKISEQEGLIDRREYGRVNFAFFKF